MGFDDKVSKLLKHEIDYINMHLPKKKVPLKLASEGSNFYVSREDNQLYIDKKEVHLLIDLCPSNKHSDVQLPIIIIRRRNLGQGTFIISGELIEQFVVLKALKKIDIDWKEFIQKQHEKNIFFLYKPDLIELRRILPTSTVIGFS